MALPIATSAASRSGLLSRVAGLKDRHLRLWSESAEGRPRIGPHQSGWRRLRTARATRRLIRDLARRVEHHPEGREEQEEWKADLRERLLRFGEERLGWPAGYRKLLFGEDFYEATSHFVSDARAFDREVSADEIGQAVRNAWIVNSLQLLFGARVELSPAVFAYSMLYPYTDNLLDDPALPMAAKKGMNRRLGRWLSGERHEPRGERERRIRELVLMIERHYPRAAFGSVFESLRAIHDAQIRSLRLQLAEAPGADQILGTQVEKGGTSVLADGYLAFGRLDPGEEDFCFGYGVFLQMLDDLQDIESDREAGHATLFSVAAAPLDRLVSRLWHYMHAVVNGSARIAGPELADRRDLILRNCTSLMMGAIAESPELFSSSFRRALERRWPLSFTSMHSLRRFAQGTFQTTRRRLERRKNVDSLWDLVDRISAEPRSGPRRDGLPATCRASRRHRDGG